MGGYDDDSGYYVLENRAEASVEEQGTAAAHKKHLKQVAERKAASRRAEKSK